MRKAIYQTVCGFFGLEGGRGTAGNSNNQLDRQLEEAVGGFLKILGKIIAAFIKGVFRGVKKLNKWQTWIGAIVTVLIAILGTVCKPQIMGLETPIYFRWLLYGVLLAAPIIYLIILGGFEDKGKQDYEQMFKDIGFLGKDGKCPVFCGVKEDGKKRILTFKSNIPLADWKGARARLETALDCNILKMEYGNSKKLAELTVLPADFKIPEMITWNDGYCNHQSGMITVGQGALDNIYFNLNRVPHVLVAGETGSGKSVILRCILWQMILQGARVYMIDFKGGVEFGKQYERYGEVITERERALQVLEMLVQENDYRLKIFRDLEVKNLAEYNRKTKQNLCRIGVFSDELAEMLDKKGVSKENRAVYEALEGKLSTLARLSRATGINLFLGVQRPDANVLTGQIKNNIPVRISGRFADKAASEIVLGNTDAVDLPDIKGRFLYKVGNETIEFQSFYFDDETMLHEVDVEVGSMLTEAPVYHPDKSEYPGRWEESAEPGKPGKKKAGVRKAKKSAAETEEEIYSDAEIYGDIEEELPFGNPMEVDDYDFDFFRDMRQKEE